jgi:hypothetical protein
MGAVKQRIKEITHYLGKMSDENQEVVLKVVRSIAWEEEAWPDDKSYIAEMNKRFTELETGKVKGLSFEELATKTRQAYKKRKK